MRLMLVMLLCLLTPPAARAADAPPLPAQHPARDLELRLKEEEAQKKALQQELQKLEKEIGSSKQDMIGLAADIKRNESDLSKTEERLKALNKEQEDIRRRLGVDREALADLILALQRIRRVPPEALLARPGAPLETAQSAMLLEHVLPGLYSRAEGLKGDLARLADVVEHTEKQRAALKTKSIALQAQQHKMGELVAARQAAVKETQGNVKERTAAIKNISAQASTLKDLIRQLDERREKEAREEEARAARKEAAAAKAAAKPPAPAKRKDSAAIPRAGDGQLPVSGIVRVRYGETDEIGAKAEGIRIEARSGALVVAPMGGVIRYSGDFRNYGKMVILEHQGGYHSLVAGLARIDTVEGQSVAAGEPLGTLGSQGAGKPSLYYELRLNGQPVNPARKIGDLG